MNRNVLVIGANGALGAAVVRMLLVQGNDVAATVSRPHKAEAFRQAYPACNPVIVLDLSDGNEVKSRLTALIGSMPRLDAIISCAAHMPVRPLELTPLEEIRKTFEVNAVAAAAIYQAAIDSLRASKGRLIFTSSLAGVAATPMTGAYSASKFALEALADTMRQECADWGVDVVLLEPGGFDTPPIRQIVEKLDYGANEAPEEERALYGDLYKGMRNRISAAQSSLMQPEDVARVAVEALNAERPDTRYCIGVEADFVINAKKQKSDREMDEMILGSYRTS